MAAFKDSDETAMELLQLHGEMRLLTYVVGLKSGLAPAAEGQNEQTGRANTPSEYAPLPLCFSLREPSPVKRLGTAAKEAVMVAELYRQRAIECERMALENPQESLKLKETAETWRLLAEAVEELPPTVH